jgi:hypothetical protein
VLCFKRKEKRGGNIVSGIKSLQQEKKKEFLSCCVKKEEKLHLKVL